MAGRVERSEFSSLKANTEKQNVWVYKSRKIFYSRSPIESWHVNERCLFNIQQQVLGSDTTIKMPIMCKENSRDSRGLRYWFTLLEIRQ